MDLLLPYKFNLYWMCGGKYNCREWLRKITPAESQTMKKLSGEADKRKITLVYGLRPGFGKTELHFSDPAHIQAILDKYRKLYECGLRNFYLAYDDLFNIGRDKLSFPDDKKRFKNIAGAHLFLARKIYDTLKKLNSANKLYIVPMYYYDPTNYSPEEKAYLKTLGELPHDVDFINCGTLTGEAIRNLEKLIKRKPFFWSNYMAQYESVKPRPELLGPLTFKVPKKITSKMRGFMFVLWPDHRMMKQLFSDFLWNADHYDPAAAFARCMLKDKGKGANLLVEYLNFKNSLKDYPFAGVHKEEMLVLTGNTLKSIASWRNRIKKLPAAKKVRINRELSAMLDNYRMLLDYLKFNVYPVIISRTESGSSLLPVIAGEFVLPCSKWKNGIPVFPVDQTSVSGGYDDRNLYFRFYCHGNPENLLAKHKKHDSMVFTDDCVEMFLQPPNCPEYYHIAINPAGTVYDAIGQNKSWNSGAETRIEKGKNFWTVFCRIPLKSFKTGGNLRGQTWKANFFREKNSGKKEYSSAFPVLRRFHEPERLWRISFR